MTEPDSWLTQLRAMLQRQRDDDDPAEQVSLGAQDLLEGVPDYEICEALKFSGGEAGEPLTDLLTAECERRNLDF